MVDERAVLIGLGAAALWLQSNFNPALGSFYVGVLLLIAWIYATDPQKQLRFGKFTPKSIIQGLTLTMFFLLFSFLLGIIFSEPLSIQSALQVFSQTPILAESILTKFVTFGFFVAVLETLALLVFYEFGVDKFGKDKKIFIAFMLMTAFMLFHLTVKGIDSNFQLAQTFAFAGFTIFAFEKYKEGSQGVLMHIVVNSIALILTI